MAIAKKPSGGAVSHTSRPLHRVGGVRVNVREASRAAFFQRVAETRPSEEGMRQAEELARVAKAAQSAPFLHRYRRAVGA